MSVCCNSITRKQAGAIYLANKQGKINIPREAINYIYNHFVDVGVYNFNNNKQAVYDYLKIALEAIFNHDYEEAQKEIMHAFKCECTNFESDVIANLRKALNFN